MREPCRGRSTITLSISERIRENLHNEKTSSRGGSRTRRHSPPSQDGRFTNFAYSAVSDTGGTRTHTFQGLSLAALPDWRTVPSFKRPRWDLNPRSSP